MNKVILIGRLTRDPELQYTGSGTGVATFTIAVDRPYKNGQGEREADFIRCVAWRKLGEVVAEHMRKGRLVGVEGRIQTRSYEGGEGRRVYVTEVVAENVEFLDRPRDSQEKTAPQATEPVKQEPANFVDAFAGVDDEDLPF